MDKNEINRYLAIAMDVAKRAGDYLASQILKEKIVDVDLPHDLKLQVDKRSEKIIMNYLKERTNFSILSEESGMLEGQEKQFCWIVDPLDGTINYSRQIPLSAVSIGLWQGERAVLGVIYDFNRQEMFSGVMTQGAWLNEKTIGVSSTRYKKEAVVATGFPSQTDLSLVNAQDFSKHLNEYKKIRLLGTAALSLAYLAVGRLDGYFEKDIMLWDVAAGVAIVQAAGGQCHLNKTSRSYCYQVKASNGLLEI